MLTIVHFHPLTQLFKEFLLFPAVNSNWKDACELASVPSLRPSSVCPRRQGRPRRGSTRRPARRRRLGGAQIIGAEAKQRNIQLIGGLHLFSYMVSLLYALIAACEKEFPIHYISLSVLSLFIFFILFYFVDPLFIIYIFVWR